jgi:arylformamidase
LPDVVEITGEVLDDLHLPFGTRRLLLRTRNSELWAAGATEFTSDYAALTASGAQWVVERRIELIGADYLSVQCFGDCRCNVLATAVLLIRFCWRRR